MHFAYVSIGSMLLAMTTSIHEQNLAGAAGGPVVGSPGPGGEVVGRAGSAGRADRLTGIALMTGSAASVQLGAATAALAFPVLGPVGVVAIRQWVAGIVLLIAVRPKFGSFTRAQWRLILTMVLIFAIMNLSLY